MITEKDLQEAIAKCNGKVDPYPDDAILMAACYILKDKLFPDNSMELDAIPRYSTAAAPAEQAENKIHIESGTEFAMAINGMPEGDGWAIMDELMETLRVINPRLYGGVIRKIRD